MEVNTTKKFFPRTSLACAACRVRKRKCDGNSPCSFCVTRNQECSFSEKKKRGPKKRAIECIDDDIEIAPIVSPSPTEIRMGEIAEAFTYVDTCWNHLHRIHTVSTMSKIKTPASDAQKVQAYAAFALTARLCGNKRKSLMYMDQARNLAGQIYDRPDCDAVAGLVLMSYYSMLVFDAPRASLYSSLAASLWKMIPKDLQNYKLYVISQLTSMMSDTRASQAEKSEKFEQLSEFVQQVDCNADHHLLPVLALLTELNKAMTLLLDHQVFFSPPDTTPNVFRVLDNVTVSEETRLRILTLMNKITMMTKNPVFVHHGGFIGKILIPVQRAIINWKSGHQVEAMESALACFSALQQMDQACLYGLLSNFPQLYLLGSLIKIFLEQNQLFMAQQMSDQIKKVCASMAPDLDNICTQMDQLILNYPSTSPPKNDDSFYTFQSGNLESPTLSPQYSSSPVTSKNGNLESTHPTFVQSIPTPSNSSFSHSQSVFFQSSPSLYNPSTPENGNLESTHSTFSSIQSASIPSLLPYTFTINGDLESIPLSHQPLPAPLLSSLSYPSPPTPTVPLSPSYFASPLPSSSPPISHSSPLTTHSPFGTPPPSLSPLPLPSSNDHPILPSYFPPPNLPNILPQNLQTNYNSTQDFQDWRIEPFDENTIEKILGLS